MTARTRLVIDAMLLVGAGLAFGSGLILMFAFHVGPGCFRPEALGLTRLTWQNLHRLGAVLTLAGVVAHAVANRGSFSRRCLRILRGKPLRHDLHELFVYSGIATILLTGFVAWLVVPGSMPILGPALLEPIARARHPWIDVHNIVGLLVLIPTTNHVRRRWRAFLRLGRTQTRATVSGVAARTRGGIDVTSRWPWQRSHATRFIAVNTKLCEACAECVHSCPQGVLGMVAFWWHRHVRIEQGDACAGCRKCLRACRHGALTPITRPAAPEPTHGRMPSGS